jgi:hypothetical protein
VFDTMRRKAMVMNMAPATSDREFDHEVLALADRTAAFMERLASVLIECAESVGEFHRVLKLIEYTFGVAAAIVTVFVLAQPQLRNAAGSYAYVLDLITAILLIANRAYFSSLGLRRPEILMLSADALNSHVPDLRVTATEPYNEITQAKLRQQLRAALPVLKHAEAQFPFALRLLHATSERERKRILRKLLLPDGAI